MQSWRVESKNRLDAGDRSDVHGLMETLRILSGTVVGLFEGCKQVGSVNSLRLVRGLNAPHDRRSCLVSPGLYVGVLSQKGQGTI